MMLRRLHAIAAVVFVAAIVVQVFLAGLAIANLGGSGDFSTHVEFGYTWVGLAALALLVTAIVARPGRRDVAISAGILVLYIVQTLLPQARASIPAIAAVHPLNAMVLFALATWYARHAWQRASAAALARGTEPASARTAGADAG
jgi:hypothetical protein